MQSALKVAVYAGDPEEFKAAEAMLASYDRLDALWMAQSPPQLWERLANTTPELLLFGLDPAPADASKLMAQANARFPETRIIGFSAQHAPEIIISAMRNGCGQFVFFPFDRDDLWQAIQRMMADARPSRASGRRIAVIGASGGTGATAIASNLAIEIAALNGRDVALLDLNLQFGDLAGNFDVTPKHTIADLIGHQEVDENLLKHAMEDLDNGVWLLARPEQIDDAFSVTPELIQHILHQLPGSYDASVIDLSRPIDPVGMAVLENCEIILIVMQMIVPHINNGRRLYEALRTWGVNMDRVHLLINRYQKNRMRIDLNHVEKLFNRHVIASLPNDYRAVTAALEFGRPIMAEHGNSAVRLAIKELAAKLMQPDIASSVAAEAEVNGRGLIKRFFG